MSRALNQLYSVIMRPGCLLPTRLVACRYSEVPLGCPLTTISPSLWTSTPTDNMFVASRISIQFGLLTSWSSIERITGMLEDPILLVSSSDILIGRTKFFLATYSILFGMSSSVSLRAPPNSLRLLKYPTSVQKASTDAPLVFWNCAPCSSEANNQTSANFTLLPGTHTPTNSRPGRSCRDNSFAKKESPASN